MALGLVRAMVPVRESGLASLPMMGELVFAQTVQGVVLHLLHQNLVWGWLIEPEMYRRLLRLRPMMAVVVLGVVVSAWSLL